MTIPARPHITPWVSLVDGRLSSVDIRNCPACGGNHDAVDALDTDASCVAVALAAELLAEGAAS